VAVGGDEECRGEWLVQLLLESGAHVNHLDDYGQTPLLAATDLQMAGSGYRKMKKQAIRKLLASDTYDVDLLLSPSDYDAARSSRHKELIELLLQHGADPNVRNGEGLMPIEYVKDPGIRSLLLRHSATETIGIPSDSEQSPETLSTTTSRVVGLSGKENWKEREIIEEQRLAIEELRTAEHLKKRAVEAADMGACYQWLEEEEDKEGKRKQRSYATR